MGAPTFGPVRAFAPCHVTGIVVPETGARDPRARGSRGAGLVLALGVHASVYATPAPRPSVRIRGTSTGRFEISEDVARRLLRRRPLALTVELVHDLPVGQGFGTSAAGALATGLAVAGALHEAPRRAVETAHLADLFGAGGLGGVAAILGGGLELRVRPGLPPVGRIVRAPYPDLVLVGTTGAPIPSQRVLTRRASLERFERARRLLEEFGPRPDPATFWDVAEAFTARAGLCPPDLSVLLRAMRRRGARAAQAMFGSGFCASAPPGRQGVEFARWLADRRVTFLSTRVASRGARRLPPRSLDSHPRNPS